ncbi:GntR family transcriptional regulator [Actinomyces radicidentis]|uniref:GntR family transcriptional regulator n=1 Tax=Actinomyces radicidentis TaxID=111015 RepID=UPI0026DFD888|nr:GntR family transcriptional regulator [Actinomyces radicidentis]
MATQFSPTRRGKWQYVHDYLLEEYTDAAIGTPLPSEAELCDKFQVSRITIRRALAELEHAGVVTRQQGRGTFIQHVPQSAHLSPDHYDLTGFYAQRTAEGRQVSSIILMQEVVRPPQQVALHLALDITAQTLRIDRLRSVDGTIDHLTRAWLPVPRFSRLASTPLSNRSLFEAMRTVTGVSLAGEHTEVSLIEPPGDDRLCLHCPPHEPRLMTTSTAVDWDRTPTVYSETTFASSDATIAFTTSNQPLRPLEESRS